MTARKLFLFVLIVSLFAPSVSAQETIHILKKGETLYGVARLYGIPYSALLSANKIGDADKLQAGRKIRIPADAAGSENGAGKKASKHIVSKGETLFSIARRYDLTVSELRALNQLTEKSVLKTGDTLILSRPSKSVPVAPDSVAAGSPPSAESGSSPSKIESLRPATAKTNDVSVKWPVNAKEMAYIEGKLYGVLLIGEKTERVQSLSSGTVVSAEPYRGFGRVAIVQAPDGHVYVYGGNESLSVKAGDRVASGAELGRLGLDSLTGKPSLFFFVYKDNVAIDPAKAPRS